MATFGQVVERIREDLDRGSDFDTRIKRAVVDAIVFYKSKRLGFNTKRARSVITSGMEMVALPLDWVEADFLRLEDDGQRLPFKEVGYDLIEEARDTDEDRGQPFQYAIQHREMRLWPIPDHSYTLVFSFHYELKDVSLSSSDGAENGWTNDAEQLIRTRAMADVLCNYTDGDAATAKGLRLYAQCQEELLPSLEAQAAREQSAGAVRGFL